MKSSRSSNTKKILKKGRLNAGSGLLLFFINTLTALILNPVLVNYLGEYYFGIWKSIDKFLGFAAIADGKGAQALKWTIANHESSENYNQKKQFIGSAIRVWFIFLPILITLISVFVYFSPTLINNVKDSDATLVSVIIALLGINLIITPLLNISESVLVGTNRGYLANYTRLAWLIIASITTFAIVFFGFGLVELAVSIIAITLLRGINYFFIARKKVSWFSSLKPSKKELSSFFKFSSWKLGWSFVARFLMGSEIIFLSILISPATVSQYIFTSYVAVTGVLISAIITSSFNPGLGKLIGNKEFKPSQAIVGNLREFVVSLGVFIGASMLLMNKSFVGLWAGEELYLGDVTNLLMVLIMIQLILIRNEAFLIDLSLDIKTKVLLGVLSISASSLLAIVGYLYVYSSIISIFVGILLGRLLLLVIFPTMVNKMIHQLKSTSISSELIFNSIIILTLSFLIGELQKFITWHELVILGGLELLIVSAFVYVLLLSDKSKRNLKDRFIAVF